MVISTKVERIILRGMKESKNKSPHPWETEWTLFGPIRQSADFFVDDLTDQPLKLDNTTTIPDKVTIAGQNLRATKAVSKAGLLDFRQIFKYSRGFPIVYVMTVIESAAPGMFPVFFGADWYTLWWLNGKIVFDRTEGNGDGNGLLTPAMNNHSFPLNLKPGKNLIMFRVSSGIVSWLIWLGYDPGLFPGGK